ncbi:DUF2795 domain-containing protein [Haloarculaceae archaeon H-GB2-1]|nr:DUF2795 domain-containing protein [Haloarculaceae archaeon H-GB1-1]MEA5388962.1 DUF2795 domain-containing protein [Haloarculaceae archaeon H-GB11]MEA5407020.1 DUF2795 domain-containing protein [Haloarculaceae archaeon H-GB2-1]
MRILTDVTDRTDAHSYPATTDDLIEAYGDMELEYPNGGETLGDALRRLDSETFANAEEARMAMYSALGSDAIGRKGYSDRDPLSPGESGPDPLSF